jgi:hypothetical protein
MGLCGLFSVKVHFWRKVRYSTVFHPNPKRNWCLSLCIGLRVIGEDLGCWRMVLYYTHTYILLLYYYIVYIYTILFYSFPSVIFPNIPLIPVGVYSWILISSRCLYYTPHPFFIPHLVWSIFCSLLPLSFLPNHTLPYSSPSHIFSVQYKLKVVRELTWIVLRFSSRDMF